MIGREIIISFIASVFGVVILFAVQTANNRASGVIYSYEDLREMKAECEKDLPRGAECSIVVHYLSQAELEKTE